MQWILVNDLNVLDAALWYAAQGHAVVPLHRTDENGLCSCKKSKCGSAGKHPRYKKGRLEHGHREATTDSEKIRQWWSQWPNANIGVTTGTPSGWVVLDVDVKDNKGGTDSLAALLLEHGPLPPTLQAQTPSGGLHFVFKAPAMEMEKAIGVRPGIDILAAGGYFVVSPSVINGKPYQWVEEHPIAECPPWLVELTKQKDKHHGQATDDVSAIIRELLPTGQERNGEWRVSCPFHEDKNPSCDVRLEDGIFNCFACEAKGNLVKLYAHVKNISESQARKELGRTPSYINELNEMHAVTTVGGKTVILTETADPITGYKDLTLSNQADLRLLYANRRIIFEGMSRAISDVWIKHSDRRQYKGIVFAPQHDVPGYYNLWQGFGVEPKEGDCSLYLNHLRENIARLDDEIYEYILAWMAHTVQHPENRVGVSIVFRGKQGTGKGITCSQCGKIFGPHFVHVQHSKHLVGHFNAHLKQAVVVFADEAFWAGDKASEGVLKAMVTEDQIPIEFKGKDVIYVKNHIHLLVASNHEWVVPAGLEERRFFIVDVGEEHMQDHAYFHKIMTQMDNGGREALLHYLLNYDLTGINLRQFPQTEALLEHKFLTMTPVEKFWQHCLVRGSLEEPQTVWGKAAEQQPATEWVTQIERKTLHKEYREYVGNLGQSRKSSETELGMGLKKLVPNLRVTNRVEEKRKVPIYVFPDLATCRTYFDRILYYQFPWDDDIEQSKKDQEP